MAPKKITKSAMPVAETVVAETPVVVETPVVAEPVVDTPVDVAVEPVVEVDKFVVVLERLVRFSTELKDTMTLVKSLQKEFQRVQKSSVKKSKKSAPLASAKPRTPSGFAKPTKLSDDLCAFLGVSAGSQMARTEVTRVINEYIKKNSLQDTADKRTIVPDAKLSSILKIADGQKLTYFNLQTYIKHHFQKDTPVETVTPVEA
jgi:chromatin remodeling complex protein RSC6